MTIVERNFIFGVVELDAKSGAVAEVDGLSSAKMKELSLWISDYSLMDGYVDEAS